MGGQTHEVTEEIRQAFSEAYPNEAVSGAGNTDTLLRRPLLKIMRHKAAQGGTPVYAYVFTHEVLVAGSFHGVEIPYVFAHAGNQELTKIVSSAWASFARDGVPSAEGLPVWEPFTTDREATMILDLPSYLAIGHDDTLLELLAQGYDYQ